MTKPNVIETKRTLAGASAPTRTQEGRGRRGSIRTTFTLLVLGPLLALSGVWLVNSASAQRNSDQQLVMGSVSQLTSNFSERVLDLTETLGLGLTEKELIANAMIRAEDTVRGNPLPITNIAVVGSDGEVLIGYARSFAEGSAGSDPELVNRWVGNDPAVTKAVKGIAEKMNSNLLMAKSGFVGTVMEDGKPITLAAKPIPGSDGVTVVTVDSNYVQDRVQQGVRRNLLILLVTLLVVIPLLSYFLSQLIRRITALTDAAMAASDGNMETVIPVTGNDEFTSLALAVRRMFTSYRKAEKMLLGEDEV